MGLSSSISSRPIDAKDNLDEFLGLPAVLKQNSKFKKGTTDTEPEIFDDTLVCPKAILIATLINPINVTNPNDPYYLIQDYINFSQSPNFGVKILKICKLTRCTETQDCSDENCATNDNRMMLWHGTKISRVRGILENGFLKPTKPGHQLFGQGIYFADRVAKSSMYCSSNSYVCIPTEGKVGFLFLCEVQIGKAFETTKIYKHFQVPTNQDQDVSTKKDPLDFDSVKYLGTIQPDPKGNREVNGITWPLGSRSSSNGEQSEIVLGNGVKVPRGKNNGVGTYNEYVVYDPSKIRMKYLINVEFTREPVFNICNL